MAKYQTLFMAARIAAVALPHAGCRLVGLCRVNEGIPGKTLTSPTCMRQALADSRISRPEKNIPV